MVTPTPNWPHQYIERRTGSVRTEQFYHDRVVRWLYDDVRENAPRLFKLFTSERASQVLGWLNYDSGLIGSLAGNQRFLSEAGIDLSECVAGVQSFNTMRKIFERQIRYWDCRPLPAEENAVLSPADSRMLVGALALTSALWLKGKFFSYTELLGDRSQWQTAFAEGDFAIFRLTPDKYHYNHTPVAGLVRDVYQVHGQNHSCNPSAIVIEATPYSKNTRTVTVIDTDVSGGTQVGLVAMLEITALMIGGIEQCYSEQRYEAPRTLGKGLFVKRGCPKSLYHPGSSTDVLLFQRGRVRFDEDLLANQRRTDVSSRFVEGFKRQLVETEVQVRERIATRADQH